SRYGSTSTPQTGYRRSAPPRSCRSSAARPASLPPDEPRRSAAEGRGDLLRGAPHRLQGGVDRSVVVFRRDEPGAAFECAHAAAQQGEGEARVAGAVVVRQVAVVPRVRVAPEADMEHQLEPGDAGSYPGIGQ